MRALAIVLNIFMPGVGSVVIGSVGQGIGQILIYGIGLTLTLVTAGFGGIIGLPLMLAAWIWGLVTAIGANPQPIQVNITNSSGVGESPPNKENVRD